MKVKFSEMEKHSIDDKIDGDYQAVTPRQEVCFMIILFLFYRIVDIAKIHSAIFCVVVFIK